MAHEVLRGAASFRFLLSNRMPLELRQRHIPNHPDGNLRFRQLHAIQRTTDIADERTHPVLAAFGLKAGKSIESPRRRNGTLWKRQMQTCRIVEGLQLVRVSRSRIGQPYAPFAVQPPRAERKFVRQLQPFARRHATPQIFMSVSRLARLSRTSGSSRKVGGRRPTDSRISSIVALPLPSRN